MVGVGSGGCGAGDSDQPFVSCFTWILFTLKV